MYKVVLILITFFVLFIGCFPADKGISNDEIIAEVTKCTNSNMCFDILYNYLGYPVWVVCTECQNSEKSE